jgi:hypothetical protein
MQWKTLQSRLISEVAYDEPHEVLFVRLRTKQLKKYQNISPTMYENLVSAESPGFYYSYYIAKRHKGEHRLKGGHGLSFRPMHLAKVLTMTCVFLATSIIAR